MYVPQDILIEILSRLAAKSLVRFRCVSNWFNCLTCDVEFQDKHLKVSWGNKDLECNRVVSKLVDPDVLLSCSLSSCVYNSSIPTNRIALLSDSIPIVVRCPPVNGLVCVNFRNDLDLLDIHIWNPTINELRRLPNSSSLPPYSDGKYVEVDYGLGHDSTNDDYVVARLITGWSLYSTLVYLEVYSLKIDSWRLIQPFPYTSISDNQHFNCQFVNSRFHWLIFDANRDGHVFSQVILSLNLSNYQYEEIPQPKISADFTDIAVLDGQLCGCIHYFGRCFDLWTMKDHGVRESWTMMLCIPPELYTRQLHDYVDFFPLYLFKNGDVLFRVRTGEHWGIQHQHIMVYKKDKKVFEATLGHKQVRSCYIYYTETLISPNRYLNIASSRIVKYLNRVSRDKIIHYVS